MGTIPFTDIIAHLIKVVHLKGFKIFFIFGLLNETVGSANEVRLRHNL